MYGLETLGMYAFWAADTVIMMHNTKSWNPPFSHKYHGFHSNYMWRLPPLSSRYQQIKFVCFYGLQSHSTELSDQTQTQVVAVVAHLVQTCVHAYHLCASVHYLYHLTSWPSWLIIWYCCKCLFEIMYAFDVLLSSKQGLKYMPGLCQPVICM